MTKNVNNLIDLIIGFSNYINGLFIVFKILNEIPKNKRRDFEAIFYYENLRPNFGFLDITFCVF